MRHLRRFSQLVLLAAWYFAAVYFAVVALYPTRLALQAGFIAAGLALAAYTLLVITERDTDFLMAMLAILPTSCVAAGVMWWILRSLGLFVLR
jgi:hypothetical protein